MPGFGVSGGSGNNSSRSPRNLEKSPSAQFHVGPPFISHKRVIVNTAIVRPPDRGLHTILYFNDHERKIILLFPIAPEFSDRIQDGQHHGFCGFGSMLADHLTQALPAKENSL